MSVSDLLTPTYNCIIRTSIRMDLKPRYSMGRPRSRTPNGTNKIERTVPFGSLNPRLVTSKT